MGLAEDLQDKWEALLQWSDENGWPLRGISDGLEEKGIPAMPFFLFIILLLIGGALYLTIGASGTALFPPQETSLLLKFTDSTGRPISGAQITLSSATGEFENKVGRTDADGEVLFSKVKIGSQVEVTAIDSEGNTLELEDNSLYVSETIKTHTFRLSAPVIIESYTLTVELEGPEDGETVQTALYGPDGFPVGTLRTGLSVSFTGLMPNTQYAVGVRAQGFNDEQRNVMIRNSDEAISITLTEKGAIVNGIVRVLVTDAVTGQPIQDASVNIQDAETEGKIFTNLKTGENGEITPQELKIGRRIKVVASKKEYVAGFDERAVEEETNFQIDLEKIPEEELKAIKVIVKDESGAAIVNPIVKLFTESNTKIGESNPADGIALFENAGKDSYYITVYKSGYLPERIEDAERGESYTVTLEKASESNSATLKVLVENQNGDAVPQASVSLFYDDGTPFGADDRITGNDGISTFEELPLIKIYAKASFGGRLGISSLIELSLEGTGEEEGVNLLLIELKPAKGRAVANVKDHFSGKIVDGAKVEFSPSDVEFEAVESCVTEKGRCNVQLLEGFYIAKITAPKYDTFASAEFEIRPNIDNKLNFDIIASDVADKTKIVFQGVSNLRGRQVSSLSPSTTYNAKFTITRPQVKISKAEVQVRIGNPGGLDNEAAEIIGYDAVGAFVSKGSTSERPEELPFAVTEIPTPSPEVNDSLAFQDEELITAFKYVHFDFQPFEGSKEISVQFRTRAVADARVDLQYRSAFITDSEELRDPVDGNAARNAFLANMHSQILPISFEGICENDICIKTEFEGNSGSSENNFEATIEETFKLNFELISPRGTTVELSAPSSDQTIALNDGTSGEAKTVLKTTDNRQILSLITPEENAAGSFNIQARRLADNVDFEITARSGENTISKSLSVRIVGEKPNLKVEFNAVAEGKGGKTLKALKDNQVTFTITDSLDLPMRNAFVTMGSGTDALGGAVLEAQMHEARDGTITYVFDNINPTTVGSVSYKVSAPGFKIKTGSIPVLATDLFSIEEQALSLAVNSEEEQTASFSVQNLLTNEIRIAYSLFFGNSEYTDINLEFPSTKLSGMETAENSLRASLTEGLLRISTKPEAISEKVQGRIRIRGRLGSTVQDAEMPFVINSEYLQDDLNTLWSVSTDSVSFALRPPEEAEGEETIVVTNNAPYHLLINHESSASSVFIDPLSKTIAPGETAEFRVSAAASEIDSCRFDEETIDGKIDFYGTTNGIITKKSADVDILVASSEDCRLEDGLRASLPITLTAQLPPNTKTKYNNDGSILVQLPSGERFVFDSGAQLTSSQNIYTSFNTPAFPAVTSGGGGNYLIVPAGVFIEASPTYIKQRGLQQPVLYQGYDRLSLSPVFRPLSTSSYEISFPFTTHLDFDPETEFSQQGTMKIASIEDFDMYFPATVPLVRGRNVDERRATLPPNAPLTIQLTPFVNSQNSLEVYFPVEATFIIQESVRIRKDDFTGSRAIQFPSGTTITLPPDAVVSTDPAAAGGGGDLFNELRKITIPSGSPVRIPPPYAREGIYGEQHLQLPFRIQFKVPESESITLTLDAGGVQAKSISTEVYELAFTPGTTKAGVQFVDGSRLVEAAPSAPITVRPTDFGVVGIRRKLPVAITIDVPSSGAVKKKGGLVQVEFADGNRMLLEGSEVEEKAFEAKEVFIPANSEITFSANAAGGSSRMIQVQRSEFGTERFIIYIPAQTTYHFPQSNAVLKPPSTVVNELAGYQVQFTAPQINFLKTDNYNDVLIQISDAIRGVIFTGVDPTLAGRDFEFQFSFPVIANIPESVFQSPKLEPYNRKANEVYNSFRLATAAELTLTDVSSQDTFRFLATRLLTREFSFANADFLSDPKTFEIPLNSLIVPRIPKDDDGKYWLHATLGADLAFTLPDGSAPFDEKAKTADLRGCTAIKLEVDKRVYNLPPIRFIQFPSSARLLPAEQGEHQQVIIRADEEISFELCESKTKRSMIGSVEDVQRALVAFEKPLDDKAKPDTNDKLLELEFNDGNAGTPQPRFICVQNYGFSELRVQFRLDENPLASSPELEKKDTGYLGDSISTDLDGAIKSVIRPNAWERGPEMIISSVEPARQTCDKQSFKLEIGVPEQFLDEDECILEEYKKFTTDPERTFVTIYGEYGGKTVSEQIGVKIKLDKEKGTCQGSVTSKFRQMLQGFFVNYANSKDILNARDNSRMRLYFKGPTSDHKRSFSVINNLDKPVTVAYTGDALNYVSFEATPAKTLAPGKGQIITLSARNDGTGTLDIAATDSKGKIYKEIIKVEVFDLEQAFSHIYSSSPLGELVPQSAAVQQKEGGTQTAAPEERITFADEPEGEKTASIQATPKELPKEVMQCQTNFCTSEQVQNSFKGFAGEFEQLISEIGGVEKESFTEEIVKFCNNLGADKGYTKAITIQAANSKTILTTDIAQDIAYEVFEKQLTESGREFEIDASDVEISSCGIYIIQGRLNICTPVPDKKEDWLKNARIEFSIANSKECDETIANAPLLIGERENAEPVVGREPSTGLGFTEREERTGAGGLIGILENLQFINVGPYKEAPNKKDVANLNYIYSTFYSQDRTEPVSIAEPYEVPAECNSYMAKSLGLVGLASAGALGASLISNVGQGLTIGGAPTAALGTIFAIKAGYGITTTLSLCGISALQSTGRQSDPMACEFANNCIASGLAGATETLLTAVPGGGAVSLGKALGSKFIMETVGFLAIGGAVDGLTAGYNLIANDDQPLYVPTPVMYGASKIPKLFGSRAYLTDYLRRKGFSPKAARDLAAKTFEMRSPNGKLGITARQLGLGASGVDATTLNLDDFLTTKASNDQVLAVYKQLDPADYQTIIGSRESLKVELDDLTNRRLSLFDEMQDIIGKKEGNLISVSEYNREWDRVLKEANEVDGLFNSKTIELRTADDRLLPAVRNKLKGRLNELGGTDDIVRSAQNSLSVDELIDPNGAYKMTRTEAVALVGETQRLENAAKSKLKRISGGEFKSLEAFRKTRNILQLLIPLLFHVDVRPVQGVLDYRFPHHVVVFSVKDEDASLRKICARDFESDEGCVNEIDAKLLCDPTNYAACIYVVKGRQFATEQGYSILAGINSGVDSKRLVASLFEPKEKPLNSQDADPARLKVEMHQSLSNLPGTAPPEVVVTPSDPATAATQLYGQLKESCEVNGYCPGQITGDELDKIRDMMDADPEGALDRMLRLSRVG